MNEDLWSLLEKVGISRCNDNVEIDMHDNIMTVKSFYFDCLCMNDGTEVSDVFFTIDTKGNTEITYAEIKSCTKLSEVGPNYILESLRSKLDGALRHYVNNKEELK